jgi:hypothetical protein
MLTGAAGLTVQNQAAETMSAGEILQPSAESSLAS